MRNWIYLLAVRMVVFYQVRLSPRKPPCCRFHPSCSQYFLDAMAKYGVLKGGAKGVYRILRCNPLSNGGYDPA
jgi:hypothetical protein